MSRLLSIHESAEPEINNAADFYDMASPGLGTVFINELHDTIQHIDMFPEAARYSSGASEREGCLSFHIR